MASTSEYGIANGHVTLRVLSHAGGGSANVSVAIVPGLAETAEDWRRLVEDLAPLSAAAITLRGRGHSSRPVSGYSLSDHCSDIAAFVNHIPTAAVVLVAFSRSVSYALEYATSQPSKLAALVVLDYPPRHTALPPGWAESFARSMWRGRRADEVVTLPVLQAIEAEAEAKDYAAHLSSIQVPTLVVRGGKPGAALSFADAQVYQTQLPNCTLIELATSSHALWEPEPQALHKVVTQFAQKVASEP